MRIIDRGICIALFGWAAASAGLPCAAAADGAHPVIRVQEGALRGRIIDGIQVFRGIPYAAPPVGSLRWRPPRSANARNSVRDAGAMGPLCPQLYNARDNGVGPLPISEDCLTLNIYAPSSRHREALPVLFWIHGGGLVNGSGTAALYDGSALARQGVVVVTINYRLGRLGYFVHPALTREHPTEPKGNYGLMDQIAALHWVQRNIRAFGGDPAKVTVFGESAGGYSVNLLMISPAARGLFRAAISESGGGMGPLQDLQKAESGGIEFARKVGLDAASPAALRALTVQQILAAGDPSFPEMAAIDGRLVPESIGAAFARHAEARVPYLAGYNAFEVPWNSVSNPGSFDVAIARIPGDRASIEKLYGSPAAYDREFISDALFVAPARHLVRLHAQIAPSYLYRFAVLSDGARGEYSAAPHASERQYVFATLAASPWPTGPQDAVVAATMSAYWVAFAAGTDPNGGDRPQWKRYSPGEDQLLEFTMDGPVMKPVPNRQVLDAIEGRLAAAP
jgi:para-nitrobenzyl esterase